MSEIDLYKFREVWQIFDPLGIKYIPTERLKTFLETVGLPLGLPKQSTYQQYFGLALKLELHNFSGGISFKELLCKSHRRAFTSHFENEAVARMTKDDDNHLKKQILEETIQRARRVRGEKGEILKRIGAHAKEELAYNYANMEDSQQQCKKATIGAESQTLLGSAGSQVPGSQYTRHIRLLKYDISAIRIQRLTRDYLKGLRGPRSLASEFVAPKSMATVVV